MTEARARVLATFAGGGSIPVERLQALARTTYRAARDAWQLVAVPDVEPEGSDE